MEWVETTAKTVEDAKDAALDQLGVDEQDAEFDVVEEPRAGLFGRLRGEARVRARVKPTQPRPKVERRERRSRSGSKGAGTKGSGAKGSGDRSGKGGRKTAAASPPAASGPDTGPAADDGPPGEPTPSQRPPRQGRAPGAGKARPKANDQTDDEQESTPMSETELAEQGEVVRGFLVDLLDAFGLEGEVSATPAEEGAIELDVAGGDLGLLIGPKGATLQAVQELSRSVLQRQRPGDVHARIRVDVGGYRARRKVALEGFTRQVAEDVLASGTQKALEPMAPADRKVVHDTVNEIDGVHTISEGEDSRRRVVILPD